VTTWSSGRRFRSLTILDVFSRWTPGVLVETSISGKRVGRFLDELAATAGLPATIVVDNGPEFISNALDKWAYDNNVKLHFIKPGTPTETPSARVSTATSETSVSTSTGSSPSTTLASSSKRGASTTTQRGRTARLAGSRRSSTNACTNPNRRRKRWSRKRGQVSTATESPRSHLRSARSLAT